MTGQGHGVVLPFRRPGVDPEPWVRKAAIAGHFDVSEKTVERWCKEHGMPHRKIGQVVLFRVGECDVWVADKDARRRSQMP